MNRKKSVVLFLVFAVIFAVFSYFFAAESGKYLSENLKTEKENKSSSEIVQQISESEKSDLVKVTKVIDGDTIDVEKYGKIRMIGVNTPESVDPRKPVECFGIEASNHLKELISDKSVFLEFDDSQAEKDRYGRVLAYVISENGVNINLQMIESGFAYEYTYNLPYKYQKEFKDAEKRARENKVGLWAPETCNGEK